MWPVEKDEITQAKLVLLSLPLLCNFMNGTKKNKNWKSCRKAKSAHTVQKKNSNHHANLPLEMYSFAL